VFAANVEPFAFGLIGAAVPVTLGAWFVRRRTKAETADLITQASARVVEMLEVRITELQAEVETLRARVASEQTERAALNIRLAQAEERERAAVARIAELQLELDALRVRVARYENPVVPPGEES
jgi:septal ring factor EnvC (AmiA/AmiB activator)